MPFTAEPQIWGASDFELRFSGASYASCAPLRQNLSPTQGCTSGQNETGSITKHLNISECSEKNWLIATIHAESTSQSGPRFYHSSNMSATEQELSRKENALACSRTYNCKRDGLPFPTCSETRFTDSPVRNGLYTPSGSQISQRYRSKGICRPGQWCGQWC